MTIEIIEAELQEDDGEFWACWLEINRAGEAYLLPVTAPGALTEGELQTHFDTQEAKLLALAQAKGIDTDQIYNRLPKRILKAFALVVLDEINLLRSQHGLAERTAKQLRQAIKNKL